MRVRKGEIEKEEKKRGKMKVTSDKMWQKDM